MRYRSWAVVVLVAFFAGSGCSGGRGAMPSPSPPSPANIRGTWVGTVSFTAGGVAAEEIYEMTLAQPDDSANVTGSYTAGRFAGNIRGTTTEVRFSGTFEFNSNAQGQVCTGTFDVSGPAIGNTLTWTSPSIDDAPCTNTPIDLVIEVQRQ